jgi:hypothetical protein
MEGFMHYFPGLALKVILLISASQVARIAGMSHLYPPLILYLMMNYYQRLSGRVSDIVFVIMVPLLSFPFLFSCLGQLGALHPIYHLLFETL